MLMRTFFFHPGAAWLIFTNTPQLTLFATQKARRKWMDQCDPNSPGGERFGREIHTHTHTHTHTHSFPWLEEALGNRWLAPSSLIPYVAHSQGNLYACLSQLQQRSHYWAHRWSPDDSIPRSSHHGFFSPELQALHLQ